MNIYHSSILFILILISHIPHNVLSVRCWICKWSAEACIDFNCYNVPDTCSNNNFSPALVPVSECPGNCYSRTVSNAAGLPVKWERVCAPVQDQTRGFSCRTTYNMGFRIDECTCDKDYCNATQAKLRNDQFVMLLAVCFAFTIPFYKLL